MLHTIAVVVQCSKPHQIAKLTLNKISFTTSNKTSVVLYVYMYHIYTYVDLSCRLGFCVLHVSPTYVYVYVYVCVYIYIQKRTVRNHLKFAYKLF